MRRIEKQDLGKFGSWPAGIDFTSKTVFYQPWDPAAVIDVGVSEKERLDLCRIEAPGAVVQPFHLCAALEKSAVNQVFSAVVDQKTGAGHAARGAKAGDLHRGLPFRMDGVSVEVCFIGHILRICKQIYSNSFILDKSGEAVNKDCTKWER